jgi:hypothetical protein
VLKENSVTSSGLSGVECYKTEINCLEQLCSVYGKSKEESFLIPEVCK